MPEVGTFTSRSTTVGRFRETNVTNSIGLGFYRRVAASECGFQDLRSSFGFKVGEGFRFVERVGFVFGTM